MSKPSLSFYTNIPTPYQEAFFAELAEIFRLKVIYYSSTENNRNWQFSLPEEYEVVVLKNNFIARAMQKKVVDFHFSWQIFKVISSDRSDFVIVGGAYWIPNASVALLISKLRGKKIAYFSEPLFEVNNPVKYRLKWLSLRILNLCCDALFCIGKKAAETFDNYKVTVPKYIIPYNIDSAAFARLDIDKMDDYRRKYKGNREVIVLSSGALIERKGMDILIQAVRHITDPALRLIIIGAGPMKEELVAMTQGDERIIFAGHQHPEETPYFFAIADVFALASRYDGWAVVINEAIAANVPIVSSDRVGAAVELITSDVLGVLCESENIAQFTTAIEGLVRDKGKRDAIKENSKKLIPVISSDYNARQVFDIFCGKM